MKENNEQRKRLNERDSLVTTGYFPQGAKEVVPFLIWGTSVARRFERERTDLIGIPTHLKTMSCFTYHDYFPGELVVAEL